MDKKYYRLATPPYTGRVGTIEEHNRSNLVTFYPIEGKYPYRVVVRKEELRPLSFNQKVTYEEF